MLIWKLELCTLVHASARYCSYIRKRVYSYIRMRVCSDIRMRVRSYIKMRVCSYIRMRVSEEMEDNTPMTPSI